MAADFWTVEFKMNYINVATRGVLGEGFGWTEKYYIPGTKGAPPFTDAVALQSARASLMAKNVAIVKTSLRLASMYRDQWSYPLTASYPLVTFGDLDDLDHGYCGTIQDALLIRFEAANGRRWTRTIRGIRDAWTDDQTWLSDLTRNSYGSNSPPDLVIPAPLPFGGVAGVNATATFTVAGGAVTAAAVVLGGTGIAINGLSAGTFTDIIGKWAGPDYTGVGTPSVLTYTLAGGVLTAISFTAGTNPLAPDGTYTVTLETQLDPIGLPWYLDDVNYVLNFCGLLAGVSSTVMNFHTAFVTPIGPDAPLWPVGSMMPVVDQTPPRYAAAPYQGVRFMIERVTNRQTGRIWTSKKARKKISR